MKENESNRVSSAAAGGIKRRRKYDRNFKKEAVALWLKSGKSAQVVAAELGIHERHLYDWRSQFAPVSADQEAELQKEVQALRRENAQLREQRDILKKTLGIISAPPSNGSGGSVL
jgi:transposase